MAECVLFAYNQRPILFNGCYLPGYRSTVAGWSGLTTSIFSLTRVELALDAACHNTLYNVLLGKEKNE